VHRETSVTAASKIRGRRIMYACRFLEDFMAVQSKRIIFLVGAVGEVPRHLFEVSRNIASPFLKIRVSLH
jgi:hypothetical protein